MRSLSNLFRRDDGPSVDEGPILCRAAATDELHAAVRMILSAEGARPTEEHIADFLRFVVSRGVDLQDLRLVEQNGRVQWALLPVVSPGRTMLLFGSTDRTREHEQRCAGRAINDVCATFAKRDVTLAQVLIDPSNLATRHLFNQCGFADLAELLYLQCDLKAAKPAPPLPHGLMWETYSPVTHDKFARTILASYENSLDCPALSGVRPIEDVIASHKASGEFDPNRWLLLYERDVPLAVVLLGKSGDTVELVYLGLVPAARGRGLGALALRKALQMASDFGGSRFSLAVDAANAPALKLYYRHGLQKITSRFAMIRDLRPLLPRHARATGT